MRVRHIGYLMLSSSLLLATTRGLSAQASDAGSEAAVRQAAGRFVEAFNNLDWPAFTASFDPGATIFHPSPTLMTRIEGRDALVASFRDIFADFPNQRSGPPYLSIQPQDLLVQVLGDAAIVTFHLGSAPTLNRRTLVFVRRGDQWLIAHLHASGFPAPADGVR